MNLENYLNEWLEDYSFHIAPNTFRGYKVNIPAKIVSERLGHSSVSVTLDVYSHSLMDMQKDSSIAFDELIQKKKA